MPQELEAIAGRYDGVNLKLDKCGGLTEALAMVALARSLNLTLMVGNMLGSSLAMAPAFLVAQACRWVDLDGPLQLQVSSLDYDNYMGVLGVGRVTRGTANQTHLHSHETPTAPDKRKDDAKDQRHL